MVECRFSIVVPVYNSEKYLHQCLESVLEQEEENNFELIIIDDASSDKSPDIIQSYQNMDSRITGIYNLENSGISQARNRGIDEATGTYLLFLDSDDFLAPNTLKKISEYLQVDTELLLFDHYIFGFGNDRKEVRNINGKTITPEKVLFFDKYGILELAYDSYKNHSSNFLFGSCWGRVYKTSIIKQHGIIFDKKLPIIEDVVFNHHFMQFCDNLIHLNEYLYHYRVYDLLKSASSQLPKNFIQILDKLHSSIISYYSDVSDLDSTTINRIASHKCMHYFIVYIVRICGGLYTNNFKETFQIISKYVNSSIIRNHIRNYAPREGHSKVLPFLIRTRLVLPLILVGKIRYLKRYGNKPS